MAVAGGGRGWWEENDTDPRWNPGLVFATQALARDALIERRARTDLKRKP